MRSGGESRTIGDPELTAADREALLRLARATLEAYARDAPAPEPPAVPAAGLMRGAFVTLEVEGALRGCIGHIPADLALGEVVRRMTIAAARDDPRFPPVALDEVSRIRLEISVLTTPVLAPAPLDPSRIVIGRDGLLIRRGRNAGLLLPQVAAERGWHPEVFLAAACQKAGLHPGAWWEPGTDVFLFQADVFSE
ncbi:MAG: AmmeMemoRadiSam system protein A [Gemmatimonadetes bacterium]|nr:AmmeMemoRadiSam system protein A [Gemmatimonadota bacterium]